VCHKRPTVDLPVVGALVALVKPGVTRWFLKVDSSGTCVAECIALWHTSSPTLTLDSLPDKPPLSAIHPSLPA
jgi:hypothetical protein